MVRINAGNGNLMANDVINYVIANGGVNSVVEGRINILGQ